MLELLCVSLLSIAYVNACIDEKEQERILDLKVKVFCYAVKNRLLYNDVVKMLQEKKISFEDISN